MRKNVIKVVFILALFGIFFDSTSTWAMSKECEFLLSKPSVRDGLKEAVAKGKSESLDTASSQKYPTSETEISSVVCQTTFPIIFDKEQQDFYNFLDQHLKNISSTSSLVNAAIARFGEYQTSLRQILKCVQVADLQGTLPSCSNAGKDELCSTVPSYATALSSFSLCNEIAEEYITNGKARMIEAIRQNAAQKKAMMLLEKFKAINSNLSTLNGGIGEMYALFKTFGNKFDCFVAKKCMKSLL